MIKIVLLGRIARVTIIIMGPLRLMSSGKVLEYRTIEFYKMQLLIFLNLRAIIGNTSISIYRIEKS